MESTCVPCRIQVSSTTHALLLASGAHECSVVTWQATGGVDVKGKVGRHRQRVREELGSMLTVIWVPWDTATCVASSLAGHY